MRLFRKLLLAMLLTSVPFNSSISQVCGGNLGNNIFTAGDFGSGTDNILQQDPMIAPGYTYRTSSPPPDGSYIITNSLAQWSSRYDWPAINSDNSDDPNGYMMVVNASFETGLFYEQQVDGLCENTLYVFSADVMNIHPTGRNFILPNVSFSIDSVVEFQTGNVPENGQWNTYGFTFTTDPGVTSITLSLSNNAPGGTGNDLILDNISFQACGPEALILPETTANICEDGDPITLEATVIGDQYEDIYIQWQESTDDGMTWSDIDGANSLTFDHSNLAAGFYYYRYLLAGAASNLQNDKCRVNSNVKVINVIPKFYSVVDTLCDGLTYSLGDRLIGTTGTFTETLQNFIGCDSVVTLELTIVDDPDIIVIFDGVVPSCTGDDDGSISIDSIMNGSRPYSIYSGDSLLLNNGQLMNLTSGDYPYRIVDRYGCAADTIFDLKDPDPFVVDLGSDQVIVLGDTIHIDITANEPIMMYAWTPDNLDCGAGCDTLSIVPLTTFNLGVTATSINGCLATDLINIQVDKLRPVYFPNAFSPDLDGANDSFTIFGDQSKIVEIVELEVYDRWGNLIFENTSFAPNSPLQGWDGNHKGKPVNSGSYLYVAHVKFIDNEVVQYSGTVTILR